MNRCYYPKYHRFHDYGGRGITVSEEWKIFENFQKWYLETYKEGLTIDRIDNDGPYSVSNCKWSTPSEQCKNRRSTIRAFDNSRSSSKICKKCRIDKDRSNFSTDNRRIDKQLNYCKLCESQRVKSYMNRKIEGISLAKGRPRIY